MKIYSVLDPEFKPYGQVHAGFDVACLLSAMQTPPMPAQGIAYQPGMPTLEASCVYGPLQNNIFGGMPVQLGMCWGHNTRLNCLEYHRDSEVNVGTDDFILLLAKQDEVEDGRLDTARVKAFRVPAGTVVEVYATTLHYAPCHTDVAKGFRVAVVLPRGTNAEKPDVPLLTAEDKLLRACNKWLLAHPESEEAAAGAYVGLTGENLDIANDL